MAIPPFVNTRLNKGEKLDQEKAEELFDANTRIFEDIYNRYQTTEQANEAGNEFLRLLTKGKHKIAYGTAAITFPGASKFSNVISVVTGLGKQTSNIQLTYIEGTSSANFLTVVEVNAVGFKVRAFNPFGEPTASQGGTVSWLAIL